MSRSFSAIARMASLVWPTASSPRYRRQAGVCVSHLKDANGENLRPVWRASRSDPYGRYPATPMLTCLPPGGWPKVLRNFGRGRQCSRADRRPPSPKLRRASCFARTAGAKSCEARQGEAGWRRESPPNPEIRYVVSITYDDSCPPSTNASTMHAAS
jgi:hypothetical protein